LIERYEGRWNWNVLSLYFPLPWSPELLERYWDRWDGEGLTTGGGVPWLPELMERFAAGMLGWRWDGFFRDNAPTLPLLSSSDIAEIMSHHFAD